MGGNPKAPDPAKTYAAGIQTYIKNLPKLLELEQSARNTYDPQRIEEALALEAKYDPQRGEIRHAMGDSIESAVKSGYDLPPEFKRELEQDIRGAQAARGNVYGNAPASAEAVYKGKNAIDLYNRNLANAGTYLSQASPSQPDRSAAYTVGGMNAGPQGVAFGQQAYNNALNQPNPWASAIGGAASGAAVGTAIYPGVGTAVGGVVGGAIGYFSDGRFKEDVQETGEHTRDGIPIVTFRYKGMAQRWRGVIAQVVQELRPDAVIVGPSGRLSVRYDMLGLDMVEAD